MAKNDLSPQASQKDNSKQHTETGWQQSELWFIRQLQPDVISPRAPSYDKRGGRHFLRELLADVIPQKHSELAIPKL